MTPVTEAWLSGPVPGIPAPLQPVAHALMQVRRDLPPLLRSLGHDQLWARPGASASIGYHAVHLAGSLDRLFTYARAAPLSEEQRAALAFERSVDESRPDIDRVAGILEASLSAALSQLEGTDPEGLLDPREVGRARLPSTTLGLLFHGAEHSTRHAGQIMTLVRVLEAN
ncbi:MAG TPA: DinB family protein [Gemmatimonadales bacterium]|nr:DinB family protein [Gemmatimonadales bacterium]